jgi:hypothetical protein
LRNAMTGMILQAILFENNHAGTQGGGLVLQSGTYGLQIKGVRFTSNVAALEGGGAYIASNNGLDGGFEDGNEIAVEGCEFTYNVAMSGAGLYCDMENSVAISSTLFHSNAAIGSGGAVALRESNTLTLTTSTLSNNTAGAGGAVSAALRNTVTVEDCKLEGNAALLYGGGIHALDSTSLYFEGAVAIANNSAGEIGGGLLMRLSPLWSVGANGSLLFQGNSAKRGSGVYLKTSLSTSEALHDVSFVGNSATVGGTFYWLYEEGMAEEPRGMGNVSFRNNSAPYGGTVGTQAVAVLGPESYTSTVYDAFLSPSLTYTLINYYGSFMPLNGPTSINVEISNPSTRD